jgi:hypothetical protein
MRMGVCSSNKSVRAGKYVLEWYVAFFLIYATVIYIDIYRALRIHCCSAPGRHLQLSNGGTGLSPYRSYVPNSVNKSKK